MTERQQVYLEVATAYFNVQRDLSILRLNEESLETLKEQLKANEKRYELSDTSLTDVARSKSAVATAYTRVASARASHAVSQSLLHRLTGLSGRRLAESITLPNTPSSPKSGFTKLLHNNSAIASARLTVEAAEYGVKEAKAMRLPSIELNSSVNRGRSPENFGTFSDDRTTTSARASISLRVPVFQADQEFAQVKRAKQVQQYNEIQLSHTIATARDNFSAIWDRFEASKLALASHDNAVEAAEVAAIGTRKIYQSGLISAIDLTETERILLESKIGRERAKYETFVNAYTLLSMIGEISSY